MTDAMTTVAGNARLEHCHASAEKAVFRLDENTLSGLYEYGIIPEINMKGAAYAGQ